MAENTFRWVPTKVNNILNPDSTGVKSTIILYGRGRGGEGVNLTIGATMAGNTFCWVPTKVNNILTPIPQE